MQTSSREEPHGFKIKFSQQVIKQRIHKGILIIASDTDSIYRAK